MAGQVLLYLWKYRGDMNLVGYWDFVKIALENYGGKKDLGTVGQTYGDLIHGQL